MNFQISRSQALQCVPQRKLVEALEQTIRNCPECSKRTDVKIDQNLCNNCSVRNKAINRYAEANIPIRYWPLEMSIGFEGDPILLKEYNEIIIDLRKTYNKGPAICFAGGHGLGKTLLLSNILKRVVEKGYSGLYTTLSDIVSIATSREYDDRDTARKELLLIDFLAIDEFDPRYMANDKSSDLFGKILEEVFRSRAQNCLPTFFCTNSPNVVESFTGNIKQSISSLMNYIRVVAVLGKDFRKQEKQERQELK